jgi:putative transcriptional regulator
MTDLRAGTLLVATPLLDDGSFFRTVVLLLAHDDNGSFGVVLNRPRPELPAVDHVPAWTEHLAAPASVFSGGPVEPAMALALAAARAAESSGWIPMAGGVGLLDLAQEPADVDVTVERMRVFSGYAGWGKGQLEGEVSRDAWFVVDSQPDDIFTSEPETLWRRVLARQRGALKLYAWFPEDGSLN